MLDCNVEIKGDDELRLELTKKVKRLKRDVIAKTINQSLVIIGGKLERNLNNVILNRVTGLLSGSFHIERASDYNLRGKIGSPVRYSAIHEYGGWAGRNRKVRIPARKYFSKSVKQAIPKINKLWEKRIRGFCK